jgi:hypothetical protein
MPDGVDVRSAPPKSAIVRGAVGRVWIAKIILYLCGVRISFCSRIESHGPRRHHEAVKKASHATATGVEVRE